MLIQPNVMNAIIVFTMVLIMTFLYRALAAYLVERDSQTAQNIGAGMGAILL